MWIIIQIYPNSISLILDYISLAENDIIFNNSQTKINLYLLNFFFRSIANIRLRFQCLR